MDKLKLAAPWTTLYREIEALFKDDSEIKVVFDENNAAIKLYVSDCIKAESLANIMPTHKTFGNVDVKILVIPPNEKGYKIRVGYSEYENDFQNAFFGNDAFVKITTFKDGISNPMTFVEFKPEVVQFYNDNISDLYGLTSTLYHNIAQDIFELDGIYYSLAKVN